MKISAIIEKFDVDSITMHEINHHQINYTAVKSIEEINERILKQTPENIVDLYDILLMFHSMFAYIELLESGQVLFHSIRIISLNSDKTVNIYDKGTATILTPEQIHLKPKTT